MKKTKIIIAVATLTIIAIAAFGCGHSCDCTSNGGTCQCTEANDSCDCKGTLKKSNHLDWNVVVFLDLSDRIDKQAAGGINQWQNDTTVLNQIVNIVDDHIWNTGHKYGKSRNIKNTKDHFQLFCYPTPNNPSINGIITNTQTDFMGKSKEERIEIASDFSKKAKDGLSNIYASALADPVHTDGSDIWGFFEKHALNNCLRKGYRNILVVVTDGQIYYGKNLQNFPDKTTSYMTKSTVAAGTQLNVPATLAGKMGDLEVLFVELFANDNPSELQAYHSIISNWMTGMGIQKHTILDADLPANNKAAIDNFFAE